MLRLKKIALIVSLVAAMTISVTACGDKKDNANNDSSKATTETKADKGEVKDDYTVKLGYYNCDHMTGACIAKDAGIFEELGLNVEVTGNGKVPQAMSAGQMDVGYIGVNGVFNSTVKGAPMVIGANNHKGGSYYLIVSDDIKEGKDLLGQKLGIGSKPEKSTGWVQFADRLNIPREGSNYEAIDFGASRDAFVALKTGQIKGFTACDPWGSLVEYEGAGHILAVDSKLEGEEWGVCCTYTLNKNFVKDHPELAKKMILAHSKAIQYIYTHPVKSAKIFAENYNVPEEVALMTIYKKTVGEDRTLTWKIDPEEIKRELKWKQDGEFVDATVKYEDVVDSKLLDESGADDFDNFIAEKVDPIFPIGMSYEDWKVKANEIDK